MIDESMPLEWMIHDVKITPANAINDANKWQDVDADTDSYTISQCRVDSNKGLTSITEGTAGTVTAIQGTYTLYIDAKHSFPLDKIPNNGDLVEWSDGYSDFSASVQAVSSLYSDNGINHWEVTLQ
ncbi:putative minor capsid protein [Pediococcus acidilactici]|uniref:putative minor capsid protein n=1 Tax=Pediococcus acidilactici TaxID=1254 RepID=UPI001951889B|nr:putative minor capsid protein [Pediococcus acidilactici]MBM6602828.1 hypothetical protein [Pediococcus acidilactici]